MGDAETIIAEQVAAEEAGYGPADLVELRAAFRKLSPHGCESESVEFEYIKQEFQPTFPGPVMLRELGEIFREVCCKETHTLNFTAFLRFMQRVRDSSII